jgi:hypothetical protein
LKIKVLTSLGVLQRRIRGRQGKKEAVQSVTTDNF